MAATVLRQRDLLELLPGATATDKKQELDYLRGNPPPFLVSHEGCLLIITLIGTILAATLSVGSGGMIAGAALAGTGSLMFIASKITRSWLHHSKITCLQQNLEEEVNQDDLLKEIPYDVEDKAILQLLSRISDKTFEKYLSAKPGKVNLAYARDCHPDIQEKIVAFTRKHDEALTYLTSDNLTTYVRANNWTVKQMADYCERFHCSVWMLGSMLDEKSEELVALIFNNCKEYPHLCNALLQGVCGMHCLSRTHIEPIFRVLSKLDNLETLLDDLKALPGYILIDNLQFLICYGVHVFQGEQTKIQADLEHAKSLDAEFQTAQHQGKRPARGIMDRILNGFSPDVVAHALEIYPVDYHFVAASKAIRDVVDQWILSQENVVVKAELILPERKYDVQRIVKQMSQDRLQQFALDCEDFIEELRQASYSNANKRALLNEIYFKLRGYFPDGIGIDDSAFAQCYQKYQDFQRYH